MSKSNKIPSECKICSTPTFNTYYGVKSCEPCKVFFKRNVTNQPVSNYYYSSSLY